MKALSIKQPWAWAVLHAGKDVENREWITHYRGPLVIHATAQWATDAAEHWPRGVRFPSKEEAPTSAIVGLVDLVDVVEESKSKWFGGPFGFVLENPRPFPKPIPCPGALKLWDVTGDLMHAVTRSSSDFEPRPPRYFTQLWTGGEFRAHQENWPQSPLRHAGSDRFLSRGVRAGDVLYIWSIMTGRLLLLGRLSIGSIVDRTVAVRELVSSELVDRRDHVLARDPQPKRFDCEVPRDVIRALRFVSNGEIAAKWNRRGEPDPQTFRGIRELTAESAATLDRLLDY